MMYWKVIATCQASKYEEPFDREIAQFINYVNAEDFINLVIPKETRKHFRIEKIERK
jgi:hypothetical protein